MTLNRGFSKFFPILFAFELLSKLSAYGAKTMWRGSRAAKERATKRGPGVAIRDYRCPEMLINLVLTHGLLLVIKQPWILLKSPTLWSADAAFYLSSLALPCNPWPASEPIPGLEEKFRLFTRELTFHLCSGRWWVTRLDYVYYVNGCRLNKFA